MPDFIRISELPPATLPLSGAELTAVVQSNETRQTQISKLGWTTEPGVANARWTMAISSVGPPINDPDLQITCYLTGEG